MKTEIYLAIASVFSKPELLQPIVLIPLSIWTIIVGIRTMHIIDSHIRTNKRDGRMLKIDELRLLIERRDLILMAITTISMMLFAVLLVFFNSRSFLVWILVDVGFVLVFLKNFLIMRAFLGED